MKISVAHRALFSGYKCVCVSVVIAY